MNPHVSHSKRWMTAALVILFLAPGIARSQATLLPNLRLALATQSQPAQTAKSSARPSAVRSYPRRVVSDLGALLTGPARLDAAGWCRFALGVAAVGVTSAFDKSIRNNIQDWRTSGSDRFAHHVRPLGQWGAIVLVGGAWVAGDATGNSTWTAIGKDGIEASLLAAGIVTPFLKRVAGRYRPDALQGPHDFQPFSGHASFPSGEATEAFAVASVISAHSHRIWIKSIAWGAAGLVGWERMNLDRHWASDIVGGALIGAGIGEWVVHRHQPEAVAGRFQWSVAPMGEGAAVVFTW